MRALRTTPTGDSDPLSWSVPLRLAEKCASVAELRAREASPGDDGVVLTDRWVRFGDLYVLNTLNGMRPEEIGLTREVVEAPSATRPSERAFTWGSRPRHRPPA